MVAFLCNFNKYMCLQTYRVAFFTTKDAMCKRTWELSLQQTLDYPSLKCCATNTQLSAYLMHKYEIFAEEYGGSPKFYTAARYLGLQNCQDERKVWVLNSNLQLDEDGKAIDVNESQYIWLGQFSTASKGLGIVESTLAAKIGEPLSKKKVLRKLIKSLQITYEGNFPAALLTLGAQIMCSHYETLNDFASDGCIPAAILHGDVSHGKSLATKAGLSMLGIQNSHFLSSATNNRIIQVTSSTTLGVVYDDPSNVREISEKILHHFEKGITTTCKASYTPRCTFIASVNKELLAKLVSLPPRYT